MANHILRIGTTGLTLNNLPEQLPLGGEHAIAVRKFPGGRIHVQTLGAFEGEISWDGEFLGEDAWATAKELDAMQISGKEVLLQFGAITRYVIISHFNIKYMNDSRVGYSITLQPTRKSGERISPGSPAVNNNLPPIGSKPTTGSNSTSSSSTSSSSKPTTSSSTAASKTRTHVIQKGDTFWGLAKKYYGKGTLWTKIQAANPKVDPRRLQIGKTLIIPY